MALISVFSAKGAPGVTTTAMLVAALWPRQTLLVDADPAGGDVALRLLSATGAPLTRNPGLLTLLPLARHGLRPEVVRDHSQVALGGQRVLVGVENPAQAEASAALWPVVAQGLRELPDMDVVIDAGQVSSRSGQLALLQHSDLALGVVRAEAPSVVHLRQRLRWLSDTLSPLGADAPALGVVCVEAVNRQSEAQAAVATLRAEVSSVRDFGQVALDRKAAPMFHGELLERPERTLLVRSGRTLVARLLETIGPVPTDADPSAEPAAEPEPATTPTEPDDDESGAPQRRPRRSRAGRRRTR